ncbi:MAG: 2Fe-2S iron-sulfur cluster binding domain-containing protein [Hydrogenophilaceae bacterium]|nr:2Fe-2S iron-sulfur cluster binding domain-containing protein [Hydrogenophilaceae bacterium]
MAHYLPLSRVARLVGVTRSTLQKMIQQGELDTFDGMVELEELLRVFPDVQWQNEGELDHVNAIKERAFGKRLMERVLPDKEVLAERLYELGKEFGSAKSLLQHYDQVFDWLCKQMSDVAVELGAEPAAAILALKHRLRQQLNAAPEEAERGKALLARESVMRIMSVHVTVQPSGHDFFVEGNDTLLEAALRTGIPLNYGCSTGNCGECKARLVSGQIKKVHPYDYVLSESEKANGGFLLCSYTAVTDVIIEAEVAGATDIPQQTIQTRLRNIEPLADDLVALHLFTPRSQRLRFLAGQKVSLGIDGLSGEYYIASCPCEDRHIEVHVRRDNQNFARKAFEGLNKDALVTLTGPEGNFVVKLDSHRPVIFLAWDDGFAPIKSLVQHVMSLEVADSMHLYWVSDRLVHYQENLCRSWADALDNFHYQPLSAKDGLARVIETIYAEHPDLKRCDIYAAGPAEFLEAARKAALDRGMSMLGWHMERIE